MVHTILNPVYSKDYILSIRSTYGKYLYNIIVLYSSIFFCVMYDYVTMTVTCDGYVTQYHVL